MPTAGRPPVFGSDPRTRTAQVAALSAADSPRRVGPTSSARHGSTTNVNAIAPHQPDRAPVSHSRPPGPRPSNARHVPPDARHQHRRGPQPKAAGPGPTSTRCRPPVRDRLSRRLGDGHLGHPGAGVEDRGPTPDQAQRRRRASRSGDHRDDSQGEGEGGIGPPLGRSLRRSRGTAPTSSTPTTTTSCMPRSSSKRRLNTRDLRGRPSRSATRSSSPSPRGWRARS